MASRSELAVERGVRCACWVALVALVLSASAGQPAQAQTVAAALPSINVPVGAAQGRLDALVLYDSVYQRERKVWVYTPAGYGLQTRAPYDLLIAFDGDDYRDTIPLPMILDTLIAGRHTPAFVAVMVDNSTARIGDLANQPKFAQFMSRQLMPWIRKHYNVTRDAKRTIITGSSAGGLAAAYLALQRPDLFGNVLSQSGAFWRGDEGSNGAPFETLTAKYATVPRRDIRFVLDVGTKETSKVLGGTGPVFIDATRRMRDALRGRGYAVTYTEVPEGVHAPVTWRSRLPVGIVTLTNLWNRR